MLCNRCCDEAQTENYMKAPNDCVMPSSEALLLARQRLCAAVAAADFDVVKRYCSKGTFNGADAADENGTPLLVLAAATGSTKITRLLISRGASLDVCDPHSGGTALHYAASQGFTGCTQLLLRSKATPDVLAKDGATPLMSACCQEHEGCVRALLDAGADQSITVEGMTALQWSEEKGSIKIAKVLWNFSGASDVAAWDQPIVHEALCIAVSSNDLHSVRLLLSEAAAGGLADAVNAAGLPALICAAMHGHVEMATLLIERGAGVNGVHHASGATPLAQACAHGHVSLAKMLLDRGASAGMVDRSGSSALHAAASQGHEACVGVLLSHGAPAEVESTRGTEATPLHMAAARGHAGCVQLLLAHGASLQRELGGKTAHVLAQQSAMHASLNGSPDADVRRPALTRPQHAASTPEQVKGRSEARRILSAATCCAR